MGNFTTTKHITLSYLNNAEYLSFMNRVLNMLPPPSVGGGDKPEDLSLDPEVQENGSPDIGMTQEAVEAYEKDVLALADVVDESRISQETEIAQGHEKNRDNLVIYITTRISRAGTLPLEAERDAGQFLYKVIKPYINIARLPVAQETAKIQGLLLDLRKEENTIHVTTLGLTAYLAELEKENNAYIAATSLRTENRAASQKETGLVLRKRLDERYYDLALLAQSYSIAQPSDEATLFVNNLNQLIGETITAYNQRRKNSPEKEPGKDPEKPDDL